MDDRSRENDMTSPPDEEQIRDVQADEDDFEDTDDLDEEDDDEAEDEESTF